MGGDDGFGQGWEVEAVEGVFREEFAEAWGPLAEGVPDDASEGTGVEVSGEGMDGKRTGGIDEGVAVGDNVVFRVFHDGGTAEGADFAAEGDFASGPELPGEVWLVEPDYA